MGENDSDKPSDWDDGYRNGSDVDVSAVPAHVRVIHLISDSGRTSDSKFLRAMENMGLSQFMMRVRTTYYDGGYEVDQVNEVVPRQHNQEQEVIVIDEGGVNDMDCMHLHIFDSNADDEDSDYDVDKEMACDSTEEDNDADNSEDVHFENAEEKLVGAQLNQTPVSSYQASSQSHHDVDDKVDGDEVNSLCGEPYYDPECDHSKLVLKEKHRFSSPNQFKEAIANYTTAVGAYIKWVRSSQSNKEAICSDSDCKWRVYASWFGDREVSVIKSVGTPH
ncbi:hypothetical protein LINGRAPRIM_LOCUS2609 [Linum grandiflorum]